MTQRVLVTGATGLLGRQVLQAFDDAGHEAVGTGYSRATDKIRKLDIQDEDAVAALLNEIKPHVVVHCAANRHPDSCTSDPSAAQSLNASATSTLATLCSTSRIFLLYISTDYVFPGREGEAPYSPSHTPSPPNIYGQTKLSGEQSLLSNGTYNAILRVPVLYGETSPRENNKESAVNVLMDALWSVNQEIGQETKEVKMDNWARRYPTNTSDVARVVVDVCKLYTSASASPSSSSKPRILQFSSEDCMTKYQICEVFGEVMGLGMQGITPDQDGGRPGGDGTVRPFDCHLSTEGLKGLGVDVRTVGFRDWWRRYVGAYRR